MGELNLVNIRNATKSDATQLNPNFVAIRDEVNGNLEAENFDTEAALTGVNVTTSSKVRSNTLDTTAKLVIKLPSNDGSHYFAFKDHLGNPILKIASDGEVTIP